MDYVKKLEEMYGNDQIMQSKESLEGFVGDAYSSRYKDTELDSDITDKVANTLAYAGTVPQAIEQKYSAMESAENVDVNNEADVANYVREVFEASDNPMYQAMANLDDNYLLDNLADIVSTSDSQKALINQQVDYLRSGEGQEGFLDYIKEAAKEKEMIQAESAIYKAGTDGVLGTEDEQKYFAAMGLANSAMEQNSKYMMPQGYN